MPIAVELATIAIKNDKLISFLTGKDGYDIPINHSYHANMPTEFGLVVNPGLYGYYEKTRDTEFPAKLTDAIEQLLNGDCIKVWCAFILCAHQVMYEIDGESPFSIMSDDLISKLKASLQEHKTELEQCHLWEGHNYKRGLWEDIENINNNVKARYPVELV